MDKRIRDKWADALESGDYKQGKGALRDSQDNFCCLGVLCEIAVAEGVIEAPTNIGEDGQVWEQYLYGDHWAAVLPTEVANWAGIRKTLRLITMNDEGKKFKTIAKYIRENY